VLSADSINIKLMIIKTSRVQNMHLRLGLYFLEQRAFIITAKAQDIDQVINNSKG